MTTDGPDPPPCNAKVFKHGHTAMITAGIPSNAMERWVRQVAELSGQRVDWHFCGGRAVVKYLGDGVKVLAAIRELMPEHDRLQDVASESMWASLSDYRPSIRTCTKPLIYEPAK